MVNVSILILSYNQEKYIEKAINSCLNQSILPFEILISDDHSTDNTNKIINLYKQTYNHIIKHNINSQNLGIYNNYNKAISLLNGNIYIGLGGDDYLEDNAVEEIINCVQKNKIDINRDKFLIISNNYIEINSKKIIWDNFKNRKNEPIKEQIRGGLSTRDYGISMNIIKEIQINQNFGIAADGLRNIEILLNAEKFYYTNKCTNTHVIGTGVTSYTKPIEYFKSYINFHKIIEQKCQLRLDKKDKMFLKYLLVLSYRFTENRPAKKLKAYLYFLYIYLKNINNFSNNNSFINNLKYTLPFYSKIAFYIKQNIYNQKNN